MKWSRRVLRWLARSEIEAALHDQRVMVSDWLRMNSRPGLAKAILRDNWRETVEHNQSSTRERSRQRQGRGLPW